MRQGLQPQLPPYPASENTHGRAAVRLQRSAPDHPHRGEAPQVYRVWEGMREKLQSELAPGSAPEDAHGREALRV
ncbi:hypothetical protein LEMLEM_LOCUS5480 [Lemmus lemmus]